MMEFLGFSFYVFLIFIFTMCTISIAIIKTTHITTAVCLSPLLLHHCPEVFLTLSVSVSDRATVRPTLTAVGQLLTGFSKLSSIVRLPIYVFANFKLSLNHTLLCSPSTRFTPTWVVCNLHSVYYSLFNYELVVGFVHRTTMNAYLHSVRKPPRASADHTRKASCC